MFCANCGSDILPMFSSHAEDDDVPQRRPRPCCANPRPVRLVDFLNPHEYEIAH
jgi:hypothetical protein